MTPWTPSWIPRGTSPVSVRRAPRVRWTAKRLTTAFFQNLIDSIETLPVEDQDYLLDLIKKRRIEKRRLEIANNAQAILEDLKQGKAKIGTVNDLIADLLEEDDEKSSLK